MDFKLPELGEGVYEAELVSWLVQPGDAVKRGQGLAEVMTDKATMELPSPFAGTITALGATAGQQVKVGDVVLTYDPAGQAAADEAPAPVQTAAEAPRPAAPAPAPVPAPSGNGNGNGARLARPVRAAPSVRLLARQLGIDLAGVPGSGPGGRILVGDLTAHVRPAAAEKRRPAEPAMDLGTPGTRVKLAGLRRKVAEHMVQAKRTIPHYSYVDECDVTDLVRLRTSLREPFLKAGVKLTYLPFFVKAVAAALREVPLVNSTLDDAAGEIVFHDRYHVGIATATAQGLVVPVVRDADRKDLLTIAREIEQLSGAARTGKARLEDLRGGTFTITSIGGIGGLIATPVVNHPEVGILAIGKVVKRPVYDAAGNLHPADLVYLSFSFDHRVVDGAVGAVFGNAVMKRLQNPAWALLPGDPGRP